jgi:hypothetical protein
VRPDLTTGCFVLRDSVPGVGACALRVTHAALNKDNGLVDPVTGSATAPTTPRGKVGDNFAKAVAGAIVETRHQWREFQVALEADYGPKKASLMTCALTHDDPSNDCVGRSPAAVVIAVSVVLLGVLAVGFVLFRMRRRRRTDGGPRAGRRT